MDLPPFERLRELFDYDPETGLLLWKVARPHRRRGDEAGGMNSHGAIMVSVDGKRMAASQIIWAWCYGEYPGYRLRAKDGDATNLRVDNFTRYKEHDGDTPEGDSANHRAVKDVLLRQVNAAALSHLQRDNRAWEEYCTSDGPTQRRILARYRDELRYRYPAAYPSSHLKPAGRPRKPR